MPFVKKSDQNDIRTGLFLGIGIAISAMIVAFIWTTFLQRPFQTVFGGFNVAA